jgi:hypothetical protein
MRIRSRLERLEEEILPPPLEIRWLIRINCVNARRADCDRIDSDRGDSERKAPETKVILVDPRREPGWRTGRRYPRARGFR